MCMSRAGAIPKEALHSGAAGAGEMTRFMDHPKGLILKEPINSGAEGAGKLWDFDSSKSCENP